MTDEEKMLALAEIKDKIRNQLNESNAIKTFNDNGDLSGELNAENVLAGRYRLSGRIELDFEEAIDLGNQRTVLSRVGYKMSSQIKDALQRIAHHSNTKVIAGTVQDIVISWTYEEGKDTIISISDFNINNDFQIVDI